jgi:hypothetical protein
MPGSVTLAFGEPQDFQAALREDGVLSLLVTARGQFRARLMQVTLHSLRLSAGDEHLPRIAFVAAPAGRVQPQKYLSWPIERKSDTITEYLPNTQVDVFLTNPTRDRQIIVDTKFTAILGYGKTARWSWTLLTFTKYTPTSGLRRRLYRAAEKACSSIRPSDGDTGNARKFRGILRMETVDLMQRSWSMRGDMVAVISPTTREPTCSKTGSATLPWFSMLLESRRPCFGVTRWAGGSASE